MKKIYTIYLDGCVIGSTEFEKADAPMGVVYGKIEFNDPQIGYDYWIAYCKSKNIELAMDDPDEKFLSTRSINSLSVKNEKGTEIKGFGNQISGMDKEGYEITIEGIPYDSFADEFPNHLTDYENSFKCS